MDFEFLLEPIPKTDCDIVPSCEGCSHLATLEAPLYCVKHEGKDFVLCYGCFGMLLSPVGGWKRA